jgi:hypothetical protein
MELKDCSEPPACRTSRPQSKNKKRGGERKDSLNRADNETFARGGELPIHLSQVSTQGVDRLVWIKEEIPGEAGGSNGRLEPPY